MESISFPKPFIKNPTTRKIFGLFDSLRKKKAGFGVASCALITGESGSGKSELAKRYIEKNPVAEKEYRTHIPVFHYEIKEISTIKNVLQDAIRKLLFAGSGDEDSELYKRLTQGRVTADELRWSFTQLLKSTGVELLVFDEVQAILQRRNAEVVSGLADVFKDLIKDTEIPIVFMGMPWSRYLIESNAQLSGRIDYRIEIEPYKISNKKHRNDYRVLLKLLAEGYQFPEEIELHNFEFMLKMYSYTAGNLRETVRLVRDVRLDATMNDKKIKINGFAQEVARRGVDDQNNPFLKSIEKLELRELVVHSDYRIGQRGNKKPIVEAQYSTYCVTTDNKIKSVAYG